MANRPSAESSPCARSHCLASTRSRPTSSGQRDARRNDSSSELQTVARIRAASGSDSAIGCADLSPPRPHLAVPVGSGPFTVSVEHCLVGLRRRPRTFAPSRAVALQADHDALSSPESVTLDSASRNREVRPTCCPLPSRHTYPHIPEPPRRRRSSTTRMPPRADQIPKRHFRHLDTIPTASEPRPYRDWSNQPDFKHDTFPSAGRSRILILDYSPQRARIKHSVAATSMDAAAHEGLRQSDVCTRTDRADHELCRSHGSQKSAARHCHHATTCSSHLHVRRSGSLPHSITMIESGSLWYGAREP